MSSIANSAMPFNNSASDGLTITGVIWNQAMQTIVTSVNDNATQINNIRNAQTTILVGTGSVYPTSPVPSNGQLFYRTDLQALKMFNGTSWIDPVQEPTSYVDLTTGQTIGGSKTFTNPLTIKTDTSGALTIERASNTNQQILIDYDSTNNRGRIQTVEQGVAFRDLMLNGQGGKVLTQNITVDDGFGNMDISKAVMTDNDTGSSGSVHWYMRTAAKVAHWGTGMSGAEGTGNAGGTYSLWAYDNTGAFIGTYLQIGRANGDLHSKNNTLDDGSGKATFVGLVNVSSGLLQVGGSGGTLQIGDDALMEDCNVSNAWRLKGIQDPTKGNLYFGTSNYLAYHQGNHHHQFRHDMFRGANTFTTTSNTAFSAGGNGFLPFLFTASEFSGTTSFIMEFNGFAGSSETLYAGIWDYTAGAAVAGSEASITSVTGARARSGSCTLIDGHLYGYYYRASAAISSCVIGAVDIICWPGG